jgi:hypothetical protein
MAASCNEACFLRGNSQNEIFKPNLHTCLVGALQSDDAGKLKSKMNFSYLCLPLLLLLVSLKSVAGRSAGHSIRFQSLMNSGDHKGAHRIAEELTRQMPGDGYSWCAAHE